MPRTMTIDFFKIKMPDKANITVQDIIRKIANVSDFEKKNATVDGWPVRLEEFEQHDNFIEGDMTKIRMDNIPPKASIHSPVESLGLKDDEGLGEQNAFLYRPDLKILAYQANKFGVGISKFCRYIQTFAELEGFIDYEVVLEVDAYQRTQSMKIMKGFYFKIADMERLRVLEGEDKGVGSFLASASYFDSPIFSGALFYGKHSGTLMKNSVLQTAMALLKFREKYPEAVQRIKVQGFDEADEKTVIDLINDKMRVEKTFENVSGRWYPWKARRELLKSAMDEKLSDLKLLFSKP